MAKQVLGTLYVTHHFSLKGLQEYVKCLGEGASDLTRVFQTFFFFLNNRTLLGGVILYYPKEYSGNGVLGSISRFRKVFNVASWIHLWTCLRNTDWKSQLNRNAAGSLLIKQC